MTALCTNGRIEADCLTTAVKPFWFSRDLCKEVDCIPAIGACCDFGNGVPGAPTCEQTTFADGISDTCTWFKGEDCSALKADNRCLVNPIPAISEWGLVILTLLLLTGAKVYFGRRPGKGLPGAWTRWSPPCAKSLSRKVWHGFAARVFHRLKSAPQWLKGQRN